MFSNPSFKKRPGYAILILGQEIQDDMHSNVYSDTNDLVVCVFFWFVKHYEQLVTEDTSTRLYKL